MSWGELTCGWITNAINRPCTPTMQTCNKKCTHYKIAKDLICPQCGNGPLRLSGKKSLALPTNRKATCDFCNYENSF
jgi:hypothetical protein